MFNLFKQYVYVQISPSLLTVRNPVTQEAVAEVPELATRQVGRGKRKIVACGNDARTHESDRDVRIVNPFIHPRSLIADFTIAEQLIRCFLRRLSARRLFVPAPVIVIHPLGEHEGGLTQIERRAIRELALGAGASRVILWEGPVLTDEQVLSETFPSSGKISL